MSEFEQEFDKIIESICCKHPVIPDEVDNEVVDLTPTNWFELTKEYIKNYYGPHEVGKYEHFIQWGNGGLRYNQHQEKSTFPCPDCKKGIEIVYEYKPLQALAMDFEIAMDPHQFAVTQVAVYCPFCRAHLRTVGNGKIIKIKYERSE